jgi:hypothetical protein
MMMDRTMRHRLVVLLGVVLLGAGAAGCGLASTHGGTAVTLTVTRGFGATAVGSVTQPGAEASETVMRLLERSFRVGTSGPGDRVESIDGLSGSAPPTLWSYYVNGIAAPLGAAKTAVHPGDRIWWDLHNGTATTSVPAVVGSFTEPFVHGSGGRRLPTALECAEDVMAACSAVTSELSAIGVPIATSLIGTGSGTDSLIVVVGTWRDLQGELLADVIEHGPASSGVYARFAGPGGSALELLDPSGRLARTLDGDAGLVAATAQPSAEPTWVITGTDPAGVLAGARALAPGPLHDHYALAVQGATQLPLPLQPASS